MRAFWEIESDAIVGRVLAELLDTYEANCEISGGGINVASLAKSREIVARLSGKSVIKEPLTADGFLRKEFENSNQKLPVDHAVSEIIQGRLKEAQSCLAAGASIRYIPMR